MLNVPEDNLPNMAECLYLSPHERDSEPPITLQKEQLTSHCPCHKIKAIPAVYDEKTKTFFAFGVYQIPMKTFWYKKPQGGYLDKLVVKGCFGRDVQYTVVSREQGDKAQEIAEHLAEDCRNSL